MRVLQAISVSYLRLLTTPLLLAACVAAIQPGNTTVPRQLTDTRQARSVYESRCWNDVVSVFVNRCVNRGQGHGPLTSIMRKRHDEQTPMKECITRDNQEAAAERVEVTMRDGHIPNTKDTVDENLRATEAPFGFADFWSGSGDMAFDIDAIMKQAKHAMESNFPTVSKTKANDEIDFRLDERQDNGDDFVYPKLTRLNAGKVGDVVRIELEDGVYIQRITRSTRPVVFEFTDFLSREECDYVIERAEATGLNRSMVIGADVNDEFMDGRQRSEITRVSENAVFKKNTSINPDFLKKIQQRFVDMKCAVD